MDRAATMQLVDQAVEAMGKVDILVNNAGIIRRAPAAEHADLDWDEVLEVNLTAVFRLCRAAGAQMLARGHGKIVNIASLLAFQGGITVPSYAAAKGGVAQLTKALANEWAGRGVNVNAIAPGYMRTENTKALPGGPGPLHGRSPSGSRPAAGASRRTWPARSCSSPRRRRTT